MKFKPDPPAIIEEAVSAFELDFSEIEFQNREAPPLVPMGSMKSPSRIAPRFRLFSDESGMGMYSNYRDRLNTPPRDGFDVIFDRCKMDLRESARRTRAQLSNLQIDSRARMAA